MISQLVKLNLEHVYQKDDNGSFNVHSFDNGQLAFLLISIALVVIRTALLSTVFKICTPYEIIKFH